MQNFVEKEHFDENIFCFPKIFKIFLKAKIFSFKSQHDILLKNKKIPFQKKFKTN
uniref:Uncharacterized protein n=1 Tax=Meloidogyne enterolobii TaxID=390850 RepID=A0A6V7W498_MELEN|nr:unnamed protein product [Meloidogyne enterolobii]